MSIEIIHQLRMAAGRNSKKDILERYSNDLTWRRYLRAVYDSGINYGVSAPRDATFVDAVDLPELLDDLEMLIEHPAGRAKQQMALALSEKHGELFRLALDGSLKAGVTATSINQVMPGCIPEFKVMLAKDAPIRKFPVLASTKYDGVRLIAFVSGTGDAMLKTRAGKVLNLKSLKKNMSVLTPGVYDGELVSGDGVQAGRTGITGSVNKVLKGSTTEIPDYTFCVFDLLTHEDWKNQKCTVPYQLRHGVLSEILKGVPHVKLVEQLVIHEQAHVDLAYNSRIDKGYEGLILRDLNGHYLWKRSPELIKMKATHDCVLKCVGITPGTGKYEGLVGALECEGKVSGKDVKVKLGTGLSDFDRQRNKDYFIGHSVEAQYNDIVRAEGSQTYSLFLPRFKRVRNDLDI